MENLVCIVPAAGTGRRMGLGYNKAFVPLAGVPLLVRCLAMLAQTGLVSRVIVALAPEETAEGEALLDSYRQEYFPQLPLTVVAGGRERQDSVAGALAAVTMTEGYVAVHDGARPFAGREVFARTLALAKKYGAAVAAVPVKNTIKQVDAAGLVAATPERASLRAVQTPQIFEVNLLKRAYAGLRELQAAVTDDASAVELLGAPVAVAEGAYTNIKLTTPEDLALAERIIGEADGRKNDGF